MILVLALNAETNAHTQIAHTHIQIAHVCLTTFAKKHIVVTLYSSTFSAIFTAAICILDVCIIIQITGPVSGIGNHLIKNNTKHTMHSTRSGCQLEYTF